MIEIETGGSIYYVRVANTFESPDVAPVTLPVALGYYPDISHIVEIKWKSIHIDPIPKFEGV